MKNPFSYFFKEKSKHDSFLDSLDQILDRTHESEKIQVQEIFHILAGKGYAALLIMFSLPFTLPIQIPGFSTPFGILLGFIGLRVAFGKKLWWPKWILEHEMKSKNVEYIVDKTKRFLHYLQKVVHPRLSFLCTNAFFHRMHGLLIFLLSFILALPLPIPFTNMLAAFPILFIGLGLLEDDGAAIIVAYIIALICLLAFMWLLYLGRTHLFAYL